MSQRGLLPPRPPHVHPLRRTGRCDPSRHGPQRVRSVRQRPIRRVRSDAVVGFGAAARRVHGRRPAAEARAQRRGGPGLQLPRRPASLAVPARRAVAPVGRDRRRRQDRAGRHEQAVACLGGGGFQPPRAARLLDDRVHGGPRHPPGAPGLDRGGLLRPAMGQSRRDPLGTADRRAAADAARADHAAPHRDVRGPGPACLVGLGQVAAGHDGDSLRVCRSEPDTRRVLRRHVCAVAPAAEGAARLRLRRSGGHLLQQPPSRSSTGSRTRNTTTTRGSIGARGTGPSRPR